MKFVVTNVFSDIDRFRIYTYAEDNAMFINYLNKDGSFSSAGHVRADYKSYREAVGVLKKYKKIKLMLRKERGNSTEVVFESNKQ